jgi:hypothetical protein
VIAAPALALWAVALLAQRRRDALRPTLLLGTAVVWAAGLAAFFTLPVLFEGDLVQLDSLSRFPFHYSGYFATVQDLFLLRSSDYSFLLSGRDTTPIQIGWFHWGLAALALPAAWLFRAGRRRWLSSLRCSRHSSRLAYLWRLQPPSRSGTPSARCASSSSPGAT